MEENISKKKNSPVIILLLVAGVVAIGCGAYLLGNRAARSNTQTQAMDEANDPVGQELDNCFFHEGEMTLTDSDVANWQTFAGHGYSIKYPENVVSIEKSENDTFGDDSVHLSYLDGQYEADIYTQELGRDVFRTYFQHSAPIVYEPYSDTWWIDTYAWSREWPAEGFEECNPNPRGVTNDKKHRVYYNTEIEPGQPGLFIKHYYVVLDNLGQGTNYTPLVVEFRAVGDIDEGEGKFVDTLENIIKTIEPTPTSRG